MNDTIVKWPNAFH